ncbi:hypothetical protein DY000_02026801 [Brassica cretica]|uniref:AT-hook motif nuclear-localized protein n=1 Tax=Brassica cretica TaxID=69181 RepID=A0ABQ7E3V9_BRACR|nr:hypothetical protein DY000_02026801 [Brassica cretica]
MDSKETNEHQQLQPPHGTLTGSYNRNAAALTGPSSTSQAMQHRLSVGALSLRQPQQPLGIEGSPSSVSTQFRNEQRGRARGRVRGRPRKYADVIDDDGGGGASAKRGRGRSAGEDIAAKIVAFTNQGPLESSILSASGAVSSAVLRHSNNPNNPSGVVKYEGVYDIIAMSGSFLNTESNGTVTRTSDMNVHIAGPDGRILAGFVAGMLVARSQVQVVVGSFVSEKVKVSATRVENNPEPASASGSSSASGGGPGSPQSQGPPSESSEENDCINNKNYKVGKSTPRPLHLLPGNNPK